MTRFLIVRLGALGDIVHAIPVAAALRAAYPEARIDWAVSARHAEILGLVEGLSSLIVLRASRDGDGLSMPAAVRTLRQARYDVALDLQGLMKSAALARGSGAARVVGFVRGYLREPLAGLLYTEQHHPGGDGMWAASERRHVVAINLGLLRALGISAAAPRFPFRQLPSDVAASVADQTAGKYALLNPGAAWPNKRWPAERFGGLARRLFERHRIRSVVLWGPGERTIGEAIVAQAGEAAAMLAPATRINDVLALARGAAVMVSGDTGPTHIGAAVGVPLVGLYGPTRPERNGPWAAADLTVSRAAQCECHHRRRCRAARWCLLDIELDDVVAAVDRRLAAGRTAGV